MNHAVILAGGVGERFWPASTPERPKQLLALLSDRTMLRETADRLDGLVPPEGRWIFTGETLVERVAAECPEVARDRIVGEPEARNTAPAIGLAAGLVAAEDLDGAMLVLPADHAIGDADAFRATAATALQIASEDAVLVLFGIVPSRPETGYGYVERGESHGPGAGVAWRVRRFLEKPDAETARELWRSGTHYWNSGLFCGRASVFLDEYARHLPLMRRAIASAVEDWTADRQGALERYYDAVEATSIDYGIMQETDRAVVLPAADWGWDDLGSWESLFRWLPVSEKGNVAVGDCRLEACDDVIAFADGGQVAALGVSDLVIVRTGEATLVAARDRLEDIRSFVRRVTADRESG
ncbi:MAG: mannose-1-phosphate guanylyltransferase [Gemmatimonadota bacterium]